MDDCISTVQWALGAYDPVTGSPGPMFVGANHYIPGKKTIRPAVMEMF